MYEKYFGVITQEHKDYLTSQDTLQLWIGKSLSERAAIFNRKFPEVRITRNQLCSFYRRNGIRRKVIQNTKLYSPKAR